jgi:hypothetical protein
MRCPICGESLFFFDRTHVREKHPKYFHAVRKWQLVTSLSLISESVFIITDALSTNSFVKGLALGGALIALAFAFFTLFKWLSATHRYTVS